MVRRKIILKNMDRLLQCLVFYYSSEIEVAFFCYAFSCQICLSRVKSPKVTQSYGDLSSQSRPINCGKDKTQIAKKYNIQFC